MARSGKATLRRLWLNIHLWLGVGLCLLLVPIGLTGSVLVFDQEFDALVNPGRYAVTAGQPLPPSVLAARAADALGERFQVATFRFPESSGWPVLVIGREQRDEQAGGRPRQRTAYVDPATGRVLAVVNTRDTWLSVLHRFHENLMVPEYNGRAVVGWVGVAMLILSLSGIYLWWPRHAGFLRGLRWRRGPTVALNLHHMIGFWIAVPLAVVSATGIYLGFPQQGRNLIASFAPMTPHAGFPSVLRQSKLDIDRALASALALEPGASPLSVSWPSRQGQVWQVTLRGGGEAAVTVTVADASGEAARVTPLSGDRAARWIRWIHEGSNSGVIWRLLVFVCGLAPAVFAVTGVMIWLRKRSARTANGRTGSLPYPSPAE